MRARVIHLEHPDARAVVDRRELIEPFLRPRDALQELDVHLEAVAGLGLFVTFPAEPVGPILLIGRQPAHPMLDEEAMHRRRGERHAMKPFQVVGDLPGAEVIVLAEVQNLAHDVPRRGPRRPMRRARAVA